MAPGAVQIGSAGSAAPDADLVHEGELVRACQEGSGTAARELIQLHHRRVFAFVHRMTHQTQDAEDVTQKTFIQAFRSLHRFDTGRPLINWLLTIARHTALNHFRAARPWVAIPEEAASAQPSPADHVEENDAIDSVWSRARAALSAREYEVLWLRFGENLSTAETAQAANLTVTHVKVIVFRARRRLLEIMRTS
ncbi:MAG TPA: sigma-70 family RNA polymerase sigma factor [Candidatus Synoicihabitans sp.]|nr:sigma-70 family RNA polymerase sigma factor [Candidatus Synoicihabitans sp.]